jgi:hypothetical protein
MQPPENNDELIHGKQYHVWKEEQYVGIVDYLGDKEKHEMFVLTKQLPRVGESKFILAPDKWQMVSS